LRLIRDNELLPKHKMGDIIRESEEIKKILTSKTAQANPDRRSGSQS